MALVLFGTCLIVSPVAWYLSGRWGLAAAVAAASLCWVGAVLGATTGVIVGRWIKGPARPLYEFLVGMLFRMGVPIGGAVVAHIMGGPLRDAGMLYYVMGLYLISLAVETLFSLPPPQGR